MTDQHLATASNIHSTAQYGDFTQVLDDLWHHYAQADAAAEARGYYSDTHNQRADERHDRYKAYKAQANEILELRKRLAQASRHIELFPVMELEVAR